MRMSLFQLAVPLFILSACSQGSARQPDTSADEAAIRKMTQDYLATIPAEDTNAMITYFSDDVVINPPDMPPVRGPHGIRDYARPYFAQFVMKETIDFERISVASDWAVATYTYAFSATPKAGGAEIREAGKGSGIFQRGADGSWKWRYSIWNRNEPAPAPAADSVTS